MEAGKSFSHFVVVRQIGKGGMGDVYLAEDQKLGRKVALKFLPQEFVQNADRLRRFEQEARAASALNHPNIMTIFEVGEAEGHHFIASEFIEGETLRDKITNTAPLQVQQAVEIAIQITAALAAAHADGYVKVLDFGLAKQHDPGSFSNNAASRCEVVAVDSGWKRPCLHKQSGRSFQSLASTCRWWRNKTDYKL
jgi:aminoglycoside phosphotransferase (APT) family kinase protein